MDDFDWVKAQSLCSPVAVFEKLRLQVKQDVGTRLGLMVESKNQGYKLSVVNNGKKFSVIAEGEGIYRGATFSLVENGIDVHDVKDDLRCHATLTLADDGECKLKVNKQEYTFWQFRKFILEDILFAE